MARLTIEPGGDAKTLLCDSCYKPYKAVRGFVHRDDHAHGVYLAALHDCFLPRAAHLAVAIAKEIDEEGVPDFVSVAVKAWQTETTIELLITDPRESPWQHSRLIGKLLTQEEAARDALQQQFIHAAEHIIGEDPDVHRYLDG